MEPAPVPFGRQMQHPVRTCSTGGREWASRPGASWVKVAWWGAGRAAVTRRPTPHHAGFIKGHWLPEMLPTAMSVVEFDSIWQGHY